MENTHIKIQYHGKKLTIREICKRLERAESCVRKSKKQIKELFSLLETVCKDVRGKSVQDYVCGLCEYDGAYIGESGNWMNECPGFEHDDCFCIKKSLREKYEMEG